MRKTCPAIVEGDLKFYLEDSENVLVYTRACDSETLLVIANKSTECTSVTLPPEICTDGAKRLLTNKKNTTPSIQGGRAMMPFEVEVYELTR